MRDGHMHRVCPCCGAVASAERVTCDHCGSLTSLKVSRTVDSEEPHRGTALRKSRW